MITVEWSNGIIAAIAALIGGAGLKIVESYLSRRQIANDLASQIRDELRKDVLTSKDRIGMLEQEVDKWKDKYWTLREEMTDDEEPDGAV